MSRMPLPWRSCRSCGVALGDPTVIKSFDEIPVAGIYVSREDAGPHVSLDQGLSRTVQALLDKES